MIIIQSYTLAVLLCAVTMLCWGSWANTQKMLRMKWPFQLFYWDYAFGVLIVSLLFALTLGSMGEAGRPFLADLGQASWGNIGSALLGGAVFNLSNILLVAAIDISGMAIAFPIGVGLALVIGVIVNYIKTPIGDPLILFIGAGCVVVAIVLDAIAYSKISSTSGKNIKKGILVSLSAGILMGWFYRFVAQSIAPAFLEGQTPMVLESEFLTPYTAIVIFAIGLFLSNFLLNTIMMYKPLSGSKTNFKSYFKEGNSRTHFIGLLGGLIWGIGMALNIIASGKAGPSISYGLGQGATLVAAIWGVFIWKEFKNSSKSNIVILTLMFLFFILGLGLIVYSRIS